MQGGANVAAVRLDRRLTDGQSCGIIERVRILACFVLLERRMTMVYVNIKKLREGAKLPVRASAAAAGYDLCACLEGDGDSTYSQPMPKSTSIKILLL